jgi:exoribonuclease R
MIYNLTILIHNREYTDYTLFELKTNRKITNEEIIKNIDPISNKLFSNDIIEYDTESKNVRIKQSFTKKMKNIAGVIITNDNKTYGRYKKKLLYKCIPNQNTLPVFLVPYQVKQGFYKTNINKYAIFEFKEWTKDQKHPICTLNNTLGDVSNLNVFYEYQLYCNSLFNSIKPFIKATQKKFKGKNEDEYIEIIKHKYNIEDLTNNKDLYIFSIDPECSLDYDDAISIQKKNKNEHIVSIYIANVPLWLDILNLWDSFTDRISTIYLPNRKRPMLPTILSDELCSLQEKKKRFAFCMDVHVDSCGNIMDIKYRSCLIKVDKNYSYEESELIKNEHYSRMFNIVSHMRNKYPLIDSINNSHYLVAYLMIFMNYHCAIKMQNEKCGIYRSVVLKDKNENIPDTVNKEIKQFITLWKCTIGQYTLYDNIKEHKMISKRGLDVYMHITSPIRRLVDLLNIAIMQQNMKVFKLSESYESFQKKWIDNLEYINKTMRSIRKVQNTCELLTMCSSNPDVLHNKYNGYIFDKILTHKNQYQYMVYIPELKLLNKIILNEEYNNYSKFDFKLYIFTDEYNVKKKIRLQKI